MKMSYYEAFNARMLRYQLAHIDEEPAQKVVIGKGAFHAGYYLPDTYSGILHKYFYAMDWVIYLYMVNVVLVLTDLGLYYYYRGISCENGTHQPSI